MDQFLDNKYVFWAITAILAGLVGLVIALLRKRQADQEKEIAQIKAETDSDRKRLNEVIAQMPIQYTLRDEFLRVTTDQNRKLDKISDSLGQFSVDLAAIKAAVTKE